MTVHVELRGLPSDVAGRALRRELDELRRKIAMPAIVSGAAGHANPPPE
jgi:hypothetical protein